METLPLPFSPRKIYTVSEITREIKEQIGLVKTKSSGEDADESGPEEADEE